MSEHYRYRKDKTHLSSTFRLPIDDFHYLRIYVWNNLEGMSANVLPGDDPKWESGEYLACYIGMDGIEDEVTKEILLPKFFGEIHLVLNKFGVGIVAHELTHFLFHWLRSHLDTLLDSGTLDDEAFAILIGNLNKKFWNAFYKRYELVDGIWSN